MLYVQLDVNWVDNPKVMEVGLNGAGLHAAALCIAKRMETDGVLHRAHLRRLGADDSLIDELVEVGLFDWLDDRRVIVHDWLDRNPSRRAIARGSREGNHKRWRHEGPVETCLRCNKGDVLEPEGNPRPVPLPSPPDPPPTPKGIRETETETETETENPFVENAPDLVLVPDLSSPGGDRAGDKAAQVREVFDAWRESTGHAKAKLDAKRRRLIERQLGLYSTDDLVDAVRGWKHSPHHRGENDRNTVYNDLSLLLRDSGKVEYFLDLERNTGAYRGQSGQVSRTFWPATR